MSESSRQADSPTARFLRDAGKVREEDNPIFRFPPAKWIVSMVQYLIAIIIVTLVEGFKAILNKSPSKRRHAE